MRRVAPSITVSPTIGAEGSYDLTPGSHIGVVWLDDRLELVIRPKLPIARVMFLISYAVGHGRWTADPAEVADAESLLEALVPIYVSRVRRALERGVLQGYRSEEAALPTVRGRWRIGDQISRRYGTAPPVEVTYDDFTEDIEPNRIIRAAISRLLRLRLRDPRSRVGLRAVDSRLEGIQLVRYDPRRVPEVKLDRRGEHYQAAVELARMIVSSTSLDLAPGGEPGSAFLIDMNTVFEDFVVVALREALGVSPRRLVQGSAGRSLYLDVARRVRLRPDVSFWAGDRCLFVGDVKYKRVVPDEYKHADLYQLTAYAIATQLPSGLLIYAAGNTDAEVVEVVHLGRLLILLPLNLAAPPLELLSQVASLATRIPGGSSAA